MIKNILLILGLAAILSVPAHSRGFRGFGDLQVYIGSFGSYVAWIKSHRSQRRYCDRGHYRKHRRYQRACNICGHNRVYHGHHDPYDDGYYDRGHYRDDDDDDDDDHYYRRRRYRGDDDDD